MRLPEYLEKLVGAEFPGSYLSRLAAPRAADRCAEHVYRIFLMTYRDYATPAAILLVLSRLYQSVPKRVRQNIVALIKLWLVHHWRDFADDADVRHPARVSFYIIALSSAILTALIPLNPSSDARVAHQTLLPPPALFSPSLESHRILHSSSSRLMHVPRLQLSALVDARRMALSC